MTCRDLIRRLSDREAGRLSRRRQEELAAHLRDCEACRLRAQAFAGGMQHLRQAYSGCAVADCAPGILGRLRPRPAAHVLRWGVALAELALAGLLTLLPSAVF